MCTLRALVAVCTIALFSLGLALPAFASPASAAGGPSALAATVPAAQSSAALPAGTGLMPVVALVLAVALVSAGVAGHRAP